MRGAKDEAGRDIEQLGFEVHPNLSYSVLNPKADQMFLENGSHGVVRDFLRWMAVLAKGIFDLEIVNIVPDDEQADGCDTIGIRVGGKAGRLICEHWEYEGGTPDREAIGRILDQINDILVGHGFPYAFVLMRSGPGAVRVALLDKDRLSRAASDPRLLTRFDPGRIAALVSSPGGPLPRFPEIEEIVSEPCLLTMDSEMLTRPEDYAVVLRELAKLAEPALSVEMVECVERVDATGRAIRVLTIAADGRTWSANFAGDTDYVDSNGLIALMNRVLEDRGANRRLYDLRVLDQCLRVALADESQASSLRRFGHLQECWNDSIGDVERALSNP